MRTSALKIFGDSIQALRRPVNAIPAGAAASIGPIPGAHAPTSSLSLHEPKESLEEEEEADEEAAVLVVPVSDPYTCGYFDVLMTDTADRTASQSDTPSRSSNRLAEARLRVNSLPPGSAARVAGPVSLLHTGTQSVGVLYSRLLARVQSKGGSSATPAAAAMAAARIMPAVVRSGSSGAALYPMAAWPRHPTPPLLQSASIRRIVLLVQVSQGMCH